MAALLAEAEGLFAESCAVVPGDFVPDVVEPEDLASEGFVSAAFGFVSVALVPAVVPVAVFVSDILLSGVPVSDVWKPEAPELETLESAVLGVEADGPDCPDVDCDTGPRTMPCALMDPCSVVLAAGTFGLTGLSGLSAGAELGEGLPSVADCC